MNRNGNALRRRFVIAVVGVALGVLVLTYVVTYGLVRRSLESATLSTLRDRSSGLADFMSDPTITGRPLKKLNEALKVTDIRVVGVRPDGEIVAIPGVADTGLPDGVSSSDLLPQSLTQGLEVSGRHGDTVFLAIPAQTLPNGNRAVVVATDTVDTTVLRQLFPLLLLAGLIALGLAFAVATWLAGRFTRPISEIERAAQQLASGDLSSACPAAGEGRRAAHRARHDLELDGAPTRRRARQRAGVLAVDLARPADTADIDPRVRGSARRRHPRRRRRPTIASAPRP